MVYIKDNDKIITHIKNILELLFEIVIVLFGLFTIFCTIRGILENVNEIIKLRRIFKFFKN